MILLYKITKPKIVVEVPRAYMGYLGWYLHIMPLEYTPASKRHDHELQVPQWLTG